MDIFLDLPSINDFSSRKKWEEHAWEVIIKRLKNMQSTSEFEKTMNIVCGSYERHMITYRALTVSRLMSHASYREIGRELWVSSSTISAVKKSLAEHSYRSSHTRGHKKKEYTPDTTEYPQKVFYRRTKYGKLKDWTIMQN